MKEKKLFCERGPLCYRISLQKEYLLRDLRDLSGGARFCRRRDGGFPVIVKGHRSLMLRPLEGVDMGLQRNKVHNLALAAAQIDGAVALPGLTISTGRPGEDVGGGLCQLANLIHWMVLHSPLTVTELHHHTDSLFPDSGRRVPFGTGTSVFYKNVDYRFYNGTDRAVQLRLWQDGDDLCGELRAPAHFPCRYRIVETGHHFSAEPGGYYRNSRIYKQTIDRAGGEVTGCELILQNHSKVLYDPALVPPEDIWPAERGPFPWEEPPCSGR